MPLIRINHVLTTVTLMISQVQVAVTFQTYLGKSTTWQMSLVWDEIALPSTLRRPGNVSGSNS